MGDGGAETSEAGLPTNPPAMTRLDLGERDGVPLVGTRAALTLTPRWVKIPLNSVKIHLAELLETCKCGQFDFN